MLWFNTDTRASAQEYDSADDCLLLHLLEGILLSTIAQQFFATSQIARCLRFTLPPNHNRRTFVPIITIQPNALFVQRNLRGFGKKRDHILLRPAKPDQIHTYQYIARHSLQRSDEERVFFAALNFPFGCAVFAIASSLSEVPGAIVCPHGEPLTNLPRLCGLRGCALVNVVNLSGERPTTWRA